jgi:hypothetical protein
MAFKMPAFVFQVFSHSPKKGERLIAEMRRKTDELQRVNLRSLSEAELVTHLRDVVEGLVGNVQAIAFAGLGMLYFTNLDKVCRKWLDDSEGTFANRLLAGMGGMDSAEAGLELWQLAAKAGRQRGRKSQRCKPATSFSCDGMNSARHTATTLAANSNCIMPAGPRPPITYWTWCADT